jgi:hypothetical protein
MSSQEHGEHASYCQVTVEYENIKKKSTSSGGGGNPNKNKPPWERPVEDFTVVSQEMSKPLTHVYDLSNNLVVPATSAGQPYYDLTESYFIQRATWTFATKSGSYSLSAPIINSTAQILLVNSKYLLKLVYYFHLVIDSFIGQLMEQVLVKHMKNGVLKF